MGLGMLGKAKDTQSVISKAGNGDRVASSNALNQAFDHMVEGLPGTQTLAAPWCKPGHHPRAEPAHQAALHIQAEETVADNSQQVQLETDLCLPQEHQRGDITSQSRVQT